MVGTLFIAIHDTPSTPQLEATRPDNYTARMTDAPKRRRWLRYSLITLLVLVVAAGIASLKPSRTVQRGCDPGWAAMTWGVTSWRQKCRYRQ
jgi:hypothetical protein